MIKSGQMVLEGVNRICNDKIRSNGLGNESIGYRMIKIRSNGLERSQLGTHVKIRSYGLERSELGTQ